MDDARRRELEEEAASRTDEDWDLLHTMMAHIAVAYEEVAIAEFELATIDDDRARELLADVVEVKQTLGDAATYLADRIPGVMTREEATEELQRMDAERAQRDETAQTTIDSLLSNLIYKNDDSRNN